MSNFKAFMKENVAEAELVDLTLSRFAEPMKLTSSI